MKRMNKGVAAALVATLATACAAVGALCGWHACEAVRGGAPDIGADVDNELTVTMLCDGWTRANVELGAFVSGIRADGSSFDEQAVFDEPGARALSVPGVVYEVIPQEPYMMLEDGAVLVANTPDPRRFSDEGGEGRAEISYAPADMHGMADEELADIAADSFVASEDAARALEIAKALRDAAPAPDLATPDIDGEAPSDVPGPLVSIGGEGR